MASLTMDTAWNSLALFKEGHFPEQELRYLLEHQEEVTPLLLAEVDDVISRHKQVPIDSMRHFYALYVLAHFRCEELFPRVIALLKLPEEGAAQLLGSSHLAGRGLPNIIASTFNGNFPLLAEIIEDREADREARVCALSSITPLVLLGRMERETAIDYLMELTQTKLEGQWVLWATLVEITMDLYLDELKPIMMDAFSKGLVDGYCTQDEFQEHFDRHKENEKWHNEYMKRSYHFINAISDMEWWACFQSQAALKKKSDKLARNLVRRMQRHRLANSTSRHAPIKREKKIGRNEPCPCGSTKKYKKCCLLAHGEQ